MSRSPRPAVCAAVAVFVSSAAATAVLHAAPPPDSPPLVVLTVGGGPEPWLNQVAIESNVRYVDGVLPGAAKRTILFADGDAASKTVLYEPGVDRRQSDAQRAFAALFGPVNFDSKPLSLRAPRLPRIDGPAKPDSVHAAFDSLTASLTAAPSAGAGPVLLYFTGHGEPNQANMDDNRFALWGKGSALSVRQLSGEVARLPADRPVVLVMVQCFAGAFGNVLFAGGDPKGDLIDRPVCGFFATTRERMAAGCTAEVNEADYHDFTSYFFAALSGKDRLGRRVAPPDYNKDGKVGMDEAFAYANITEPSIDVPVATSDVFLRRFVRMADREVEETPYAKVLASASPAQKAALDGISKAIGETGPDRLKVAMGVVRDSLYSEPNHSFHDPEETARLMTAFKAAREELIRRFPELAPRRYREDSAAVLSDAVAYLAERPQTVATVLKAQAVYAKRGTSDERDELRAARCLRLVRVAKSVLLEKRLRASGDAALIARFDALKALEAGNPLRPEASGRLADRPAAWYHSTVADVAQW